MTIKPADLLHVVEAPSGAHWLYFRSGDVVLFSPATGEVLAASHVPSDEDVRTFQRRNARGQQLTHPVRATAE